MEFNYPPAADAYRKKVCAFLDQHLPAGWKGIGALNREEAAAFTDAWRETLRDNGFLAVNWPKEYGGQGLTSIEAAVISEEFARVGVPTVGPNDMFGISMLGNTLLAIGTEEQKKHYLPRVLKGEDLWCQGFSEPAAGSDLGNLGCRAVLDGDEWIINGQKTWNTGGHMANHIFVLARTAPDEVKHRGITFLLVDMRQPGVEVRPIRMMSGDSEFNEVFFTDARCPKGNVVGEVNGGWMVTMTLLGNERGAGAAINAIGFRAELDKLIELAREKGVASDPRIRQRLAKCYSVVQVMRYLGMRTLTQFLAGHHPGPDGAIFKLYWSEYHKVVTELGIDIMGMDALVPSGRKPSSAFQTDDAGAPNDSMSWATTFLNARAGTIYAGSSQVQRNIIGEMVLGLPKEPKPN